MKEREAQMHIRPAQIEQIQVAESAGAARSWQVLLLSAQTAHELEHATTSLLTHLKARSDLPIADIAYTSQMSSRATAHRRMVLCQGHTDAIQTLETRPAKRMVSAEQARHGRPVVFLFTGQGSQYVNMTRELYQEEPAFRQQVDRCAALLHPHLGQDLRELLYPASEQSDAAARQLEQTAITQPALFVIEYALARLWMQWGIYPQAMVGHSIGEYVAACLAGVFTLEDALFLVATRGQMMQQLPHGSMLSVPLSADELQARLQEQTELSLATINAPAQCVVSGPTEAIDHFSRQLAEQGIACRQLHTSHAFHSAMMEPILPAFTECVARLERSVPRIPYLSNVTGTWITADEARDPHYWATHLRQTVRFAENVQALSADPDCILLEIGPGATLTSLVKKQLPKDAAQVVLSSLRGTPQRQEDVVSVLSTLGQLWLAGVRIDWTGLYTHEQRQHVSLPFHHERFKTHNAQRVEAHSL